MGSSKGSAKFENTANFGKNLCFNTNTFFFPTFSIEICVIIPLPLATLERIALKQCMPVIKTLLRTLGVPQTIFVKQRGSAEVFVGQKGSA